MESVVIPHAIFETHIFASTDATREHLTYVQISMCGDHVIGRATDGHRAFEIRVDGIFPNDKELYISKANAQKLCKAASTIGARRGMWTVKISEEGSSDCCHSDLVTTISIPVLHELSTPYPDIMQIFPMAVSGGSSAANLWGMNLTYLLDIERWRKRVDLCVDPNWVKVQTPSDPSSPLLISEWSASADIQWRIAVMPARLP